MTRSPRTTPEQLGKARVRSLLEGRLLDAMSADTHKLHGDAKAKAIGAMTGTIVEVGAGTGVNMRYYAAGVRVIAIEPNPNMHERLQASADRHGVDLEIRTVQGERMDVDDGAADGVVGTLVLCGVDDPSSVVSEIWRVLKPGGTYFFLEHVAAEAGTSVRRVQDLVLRPHRWAANGCETNRETGLVIEAAGFSNVESRVVDPGRPAAYIRPHLVGTATR